MNHLSMWSPFHHAYLVANKWITCSSSCELDNNNITNYFIVIMWLGTNKWGVFLGCGFWNNADETSIYVLPYPQIFPWKPPCPCVWLILVLLSIQKWFHTVLNYYMWLIVEKPKRWWMLRLINKSLWMCASIVRTSTTAKPSNMRKMELYGSLLYLSIYKYASRVSHWGEEIHHPQGMMRSSSYQTQNVKLSGEWMKYTHAWASDLEVQHGTFHDRNTDRIKQTFT